MQSPQTTTDKHLPDSDLVRRAADGDTAAFEAIMRRYNQLLFRTARSVLKSDSETEDAVQEAYFSAWRSLAGFRADAKLSTWLVRIVLNEALGRVRQRTGNVVPLDMVAGQLLLEDDTAMEADQDAQPDRVAARAQFRRLVEARIDELPAQFRTIFMLRAVQEWTVDEVAAALGIPEATVRTRFFRARGLLRESLARDIDVGLEDAFSFAGARCDRIVAGVLAGISRDGEPPSDH
jgi:RNA polymerase sigma-70 factor, ECF subfamily